MEQMGMRQVNFGRVSCEKRQIGLDRGFHEPANEGIFGGGVGNAIGNSMKIHRAIKHLPAYPGLYRGELI